MRGAVKVGDIREGLLGQQAEPFRRHLEDLGALEGAHGDVVRRQLPVLGLVRCQREHFLEREFRHARPPQSIEH